MKILFINSLYTPHILGGAERSVQFMAEGLKELGHDTAVITTGPEDKREEINGVVVHYLKTPNLYWIYNAKTQLQYKKPLWHLLDARNIFFDKKLAEVIEAEKPDLVHSNNLAGLSVQVWKTSKRFGLPVVHTTRDYYLLCPKSGMYKNGRNCPKQCLPCRFYSLPKKKMSQLVDAVVGVSRFTLEKHLKFGYFQRARVKTFIYNPVGKVKESPDSRRDHMPVVFGFIGAISPDKGTAYLLDKFSRMKLDHARLKIFGRGVTPEYENALKEKYAADNIEFMGFQNPDEIYAQIDVSIISSLWHEPFPRILLESYGRGIPVIATRRGGTSEMIKENETGFTFDPDRDGELEEKIGYFADHPESIDRFSDKCRAITAEFATGKILERYLDVYKAILE